ncbi:MAG: membrane protein insertion efficiency factor YidD [candidate division NC10 bacterium]|nr:membrane protein insertion efficiency factor YidD [candidate division NC10 bacterium]
MQKNSPTPLAKIALKPIAVYRRLVSPLFPPACRFIPTCSAYAEEAIARHGLARGLMLATMRLLKCHPRHPGGFDPVRERNPIGLPRRRS